MRCKKCVLALSVGTWLLANTASAAPLSLEEAARKTLEKHPTLKVFEYREQSLVRQREVSALRPGFELGTELENIFGTGTTSGLDQAELTVSLSSVIELGTKRQARIASIDAQTALVRAQRQFQSLDVLGAMTRQFIDVLAFQEHLKLTRDSEALAEATITTIRTRVDAGAAPDAELLRVQAVLSQARLRTAQISRELEVSSVTLATYWGERRSPSSAVQGDLYAFGPAIEFETLYQHAVESPVVHIFATEERMLDAALALSESQNKADLRWSFGVRRLQGPGDTALVATVQLPLFTGPRNRGAVAASLAELNEVAVRREQALNELYARLFDGYRTRAQSIDAAHTLRDETIPALSSALAATRSAYESGRYSYLDLIAAQQALLDAKATLIDVAATALKAGVVLEQLTGLPLNGGEPGQQSNQEHAP